MVDEGSLPQLASNQVGRLGAVGSFSLSFEAASETACRAFFRAGEVRRVLR